MPPKAKAAAEDAGIPPQGMYGEDEMRQYAMEQAALAFKDAALQTALTIMLQTRQPGWVIEAMLGIRAEYGLDNSMFIRQDAEPAEENPPS